MSGPGPATRPAASQPARAAPTCDERIKGLEAWVKKLQQDRSPISIMSDRLELVERGGPAVKTYGPALELEHQSDGEPDLVILEHRMGQLLKTRSLGSVPWYIAADRRLSWGAIAYLAHVAPKKRVDTFRFIFQAKETAAKPPPSPMDAAVRWFFERFTVDPSAPARLIGEGMPDLHPTVAALLKKCPGLRKSLKNIFKPALMCQDVARAVRDCGCKPNMAEVQTWLRFQLILADRRQPKSSLVVRLAGPKDKDAVEFTLPADRPWILAHKELEQAVKAAGPRPLRLLASR